MYDKRLVQNSLILIPIFFLGLGTIMIYSSSSIFAAQRFYDSAYFLKKQLLFGVCGLFSMFIVMRIPYRIYGKLAYFFWGLSIMLLIMVLIPGIGTTVGGASRWLRFGAISFQPSEFAKLSLIILLSHSLAKKEHKIKSFSIGVLPHLMFVLPLCILINMQPDFGTVILIMVLLYSLLFVAGVPLRYLAVLGTIFIAGGFLTIVSTEYRLERLLAFMNPWEHYHDSGFQVIQSYLAFGAGGIWGTGLGNGSQKLFYLPEPHTDFIFSVVGEELGFIGIVGILLLFGILLYCGVQVSIHASNLFGTYLSMGVIFLITMQALINMGVVIGLLPTKGTTLPFISYGGTSLLINMIGIGIILGISTQSDCRAGK
jgi:cell division protein FtsW